MVPHRIAGLRTLPSRPIRKSIKRYGSIWCLTAIIFIVEVRLGPAAVEPLRALVDQQAK